jgi:ribosomal protein S18 acetylase RimI-like enzyme
MPSFSIRKAHRDDAAGMAKVHLETWRSAYQGILPADFLDGLSIQTTAEKWRAAFIKMSVDEAIFVAENEAKEIVGIASCGPERSQDPIYQGEIYVLYVLPACQRQRVGRRLVAACVQHLITQISAETLLIWVMAENPYRAFYESLGGSLVREKSVQVGGKMILDVGYGWEEIHRLMMP